MTGCTFPLQELNSDPKGITNMAEAILVIKNLESVQPFRRYIQKVIEKGLKDLIDSGTLDIDFTGKTNSGNSITFTTIKLNKIKNWSSFAPFGSNFQVYVNSMEEANYCEDINDYKTCKVRYRHKENELGCVLANTAMHEIGHLFGLTDKNSYAGADDAGHTGDPRNFMFDYPNHKDYSKYKESYNRSKLYTIQNGDTLWGISQKIGFVHPVASWKDLYNFKGKDGKSNRDRLKSKDPDKIYPGEQIWVPDIDAIIEWYRKVEAVPKEFTKVQIKKMRSEIKSLKVPRSVHTF
jgi:hypothetical protein